MKATPAGMPGLRRTRMRTRMRWTLRRFGFHRNCMRRPLDRAQSIFGFGLFLAFLVLGPIVAAAAVQHAYVTGVRAERQQSAHRHLVDATVVRRDGPPATVSGQTLGGRDRVRWRAPDGSWHQGVIDTNRRIGEHVALWADDSDALAGAPQTRTQTLGTAGFAGAGGLATVAAPLALGYALFRRRADRLRAAAWRDEWALISPHWTGRS
jgi:hypothetical protein